MHLQPIYRGTRSLIFLGALLLGACGGGGGGSSSTPAQTTSPPVGFAPSSTLASMCAVPRTGTDPYTGLAYPDRQGSLTNEESWLRSYMNESYLWYNEVPVVNPAAYSVAINGSVGAAMNAYFQALKTPVLTPSGKRKDAFSFTYPTAAWDALSQSGVQAGYGLEYAFLSSTPPRRVLVAYQDPGATGQATSVQRGASIVTIDGVDLANGSEVATLNAGLYPATTGESHTFVIMDAGATSTRTVTLVSSNVTITPVQDVSTFPVAGGTVGYMLFTDHIATSESQLINAISSLRASNVTDLVLDIRYNGGGYLAIASELAYMIAGPGPTTGATFEKLSFNDHDAHASDPSNTTPFYSQALGFSAPAGTALPQLGLSRVYVLTGGNTCSASEAIINGLRGVGVTVILIGSTTCGKPYGFYQADNCGTSYFAIEFKGVNALGFGDYADGFAPTCQISDDFSHALGDPSEGQFAAALAYRTSSTCSTGVAAREQRHGLESSTVQMFKPPWRENRLLRSAY